MDFEFLLRRARAHLGTDPKRAATLADVLIRDFEPKDPEWHSLLGSAADALGDHTTAAMEASRAVALSPANPTYRENMQSALRRLAKNPGGSPVHGHGARLLLERMARQGKSREEKPHRTRARQVDFCLPMTTPNGSELNVIEVAARLRPRIEARIWSDVPPHPELLERDPTISVITPDNLPSGDTLAIMGLFPQPGSWLRRVRPRRIVLHFNVFNLPDLLRWLGAAGTLGAEQIDILFPSNALRETLGVDGGVLYSPIDTAYFEPRRPINSVEVVGRMSRDAPTKHHPQDPVLYERLIGAGYEIRVLGGTHLAPFVPKRNRLTVLPEHAMPAREFLHSLDLFLYRTGNSFETWGRVVTEAMACCLPVVCHRAGGYAEIIRHGENGFLFDSADEAIALIDALRNDAPRLKRIGEAARQTVLDLFTPATDERMVRYFLGGT